MKNDHFQKIARHVAVALALCVAFGAGSSVLQISDATPANFKIAFFGDQGLGDDARAVLTLVKSEGAHAVVHLGDFDYQDDPAAWDAQINEVLGANFPYFACIGNHDENKWSGSDGYQRYLQDRLNRLGITWEGDLGVKSALRYMGIFIVLTGPDVIGSDHDLYIRDKLAADNAVWSIAGWHKNMELMQVGGKSDETGWGVYEEARNGGAIIATAHEHSYSRTHLLSSIINQTVASRSNTLVLTKGKTFAFVSGLGGSSIRNQEHSGEWWASIYTSSQGANYGALFGVFNVNGVRNLANFYFKDITGRIADHFDVISNVEGGGGTDDDVTDTTDTNPPVAVSFALEQNYPNPFSSEGSFAGIAGGGSTAIRFYLTEQMPAKLTIINLLGEPVRVLADGDMPAGWNYVRWDGLDNKRRRAPSGTYVYRLESNKKILTKKLLILK